VKHACIDADQIGSVLELPADDPRRRHLEECPRCRNLARAYAAFIGAEAPAGARPEEARRHLGGVIRAEAAKDAERSHEARQPFRWMQGWWRPAGIVAAAAAVVLVAAVVWMGRGPATPPLLRSEGGTAGALVTEPAAIADGAVHLTWHPVAGADRYQVRIYDADLDEVYRSVPGPDTSVVIPRADIPVPEGNPGMVWRVHAFHGDDPVAVSAPGAIPTP